MVSGERCRLQVRPSPSISRWKKSGFPISLAHRFRGDRRDDGEADKLPGLLEETGERARYRADLAIAAAARVASLRLIILARGVPLRSPALVQAGAQIFNSTAYRDDVATVAEVRQASLSRSAANSNYTCYVAARASIFFRRRGASSSRPGSQKLFAPRPVLPREIYRHPFIANSIQARCRTCFVRSGAPDRRERRMHSTAIDDQ